MTLEKEDIHSAVFRCILLLTFLPLLFINIRNDQDWGDDNAQYVHQAKNIIEHIPQYQAGYLYNKNFPLLGPPSYTVGFPLLLSPVYFIYGNTVSAFDYYLSFFACLLIILFIAWSKNYLASWKSLLLILVCLYNPWFMRFKAEINSEIPFTVFLFWIFYFFEKRKNAFSFSDCIFLSMLSGFLISIRLIGFVVPIAVFIYALYYFLLNKTISKKQFIRSGIMIPVLSVCFFLILNYVLFPISSGKEINQHINKSLFTGDIRIIVQNLKLYYDILEYFICTNTGNQYAFIGTIAVKVFMICMIAGIIIRIRKSLQLTEIILSLYLLVLLSYNYGNSGFRFLLPVTPLLFFYAGTGFDFFTKIIPYRKALILANIIACYLLYSEDWSDIIYKQNVIQAGPMEVDARVVFDYLKTETPAESGILFIKPRALSLYAERNSFSNLPDENQEEFIAQARNFKISYLLQCKEMRNPALDEYISKHPEKLILEKESGDFRLYKFR